MPVGRDMINKPWFRMIQHLLFWGASFLIFLYVFKIGTRPTRIDYIYTVLFHVFIIPPVYIDLEILIPQLRRSNNWQLFVLLNLLSVLVFTWLNQKFFSEWSNQLMPNYFFISYYSFSQVALVFVAYLSVTFLIKLSKSWFVVSSLQTKLLAAERARALNEKELLELEAKALRAQMNPHFIFNCMNSIKAMIQEGQKERSIEYLTVFSKLIRTLFQNSDKRQISLYDEIETCKLYMQLEGMRFGPMLDQKFVVDNNLDLKSVKVPALLIQPFIENAIWHGIVPKNNGSITVTVKGEDDEIICIVDDNGIGREMSRMNKPATAALHESKGIRLSQTRLDLEKLLNESEASIEIMDKYENGVATGTKVVINFSLQ